MIYIGIDKLFFALDFALHSVRASCRTNVKKDYDCVVLAKKSRHVEKVLGLLVLWTVFERRYKIISKIKEASIDALNVRLFATAAKTTIEKPERHPRQISTITWLNA